ncbi:hypothetical protein OG429_17490 [Streptomyces sp. NBC_00190]|uniref:hypothetical protein n=1 Tax=unclassified Streptomyces TaxID=2593676 RepID=UPI002E29FE8C|nr:hypothetical protein [Streptomyces sp. NBC_00190]WSZ40908.1 hypothetical protein OG239_20190 [Streptomyces sp. NBC_00868]
MGNGFRYRAERISLGTMAAAGIAVLVADLLGWLDKMAPGGTLPKITLLILSTVTLFLLMEFDRLKVLDNINRQISGLTVDGLTGDLRRRHYLGVVQVHESFPEQAFIGLVRAAEREVAILQTWIPNLTSFKDELAQAVKERQVEVNILLLHPSSPVAGLRDEALGSEPSSGVVDVDASLRILGVIHSQLPPDLRGKLRVKVYNSLPSIAVYKADERYLVSSFLHRRLAIESTQTEIEGSDTVMGREVQNELNTLWGIGSDVDLRDWHRSIESTNQ